MRSTSLALALVSSAIIAYQLSLMRILSLIQWHHLAFMIISVALLGFGASGTFLFLFRRTITKHFEVALFIALLACSLAMMLAPYALQVISFDLYLIIWDTRQIWLLFILCFVFFLPFFFGASAIGMTLMHYAEAVHSLYFANLIGSAIGGLVAIGLMFLLHPIDIPPAVALLAISAALVTIPLIRKKIGELHIVLKTVFATLVIGTFAMTILSWVFPLHLTMSEYKSLSKTLLLPDATTIQEKTSPMGVINVVQSSVLRYAPSLSLAFQGEIPTQLGVFVDGEWTGTIINQDQSKHIHFLDYTTSSLPYKLSNNPTVLVVGAGTGTETQLALQQEARQIAGIELNPQMVELIKDDFADETRGLYNRPTVEIMTGEARAFLSQTNRMFDIISIPLMEGFSASAAGMHSLFENYLFTVESFSLMFDRLTDSGFIAATVWMNHPPRHSMKLLSTLIEVLRRKEINSPALHLVGIRSWGSVTLMISKIPFPDETLQKIKTFCETNSFDPIFYPGLTEEHTNQYNQLEHDFLFDAARELLFENEKAFYEKYPFYVKPATDDQPYFSRFLKLQNIPAFFELLGKEFITFMDWGYVVLLATLTQVTGLSLLFIIIPLLFMKRKNIHDTSESQRPERHPVPTKSGSGSKPGNPVQMLNQVPQSGMAPQPLIQHDVVVKEGIASIHRSKTLRTFLYFSGLGFGFMFIEIVLIQKFILFLAHPIYAVSAVISGLLFFAGLGSWFSNRISTKIFRLSLVSIVVLGLLYGIVLDDVFSLLSSIPLWLKYTISLIIIAPLAFLMGMPFPTGIAALSKRASRFVPWAWGINGCSSVVGVVLATFVAIEFGFGVVIAVASLCYGIVYVVGNDF
ncbi:MAG: hypothetical protein HY707_14135 [Ignavibacteriae bacterium]|nr:hypothetical protein [Ignavibacteriota bacterium]